MGILRVIPLLLVAVLLGACAIPVPLQVASWVLDGVSMVTTQKSLSDHGLSILAQKDCAIWRGLKGEDLCQEGDPLITLALYDKNTDTPARVANDKTANDKIANDKTADNQPSSRMNNTSVDAQGTAKTTEIIALASFETASGSAHDTDIIDEKATSPPLFDVKQPEKNNEVVLLSQPREDLGDIFASAFAVHQQREDLGNIFALAFAVHQQPEDLQDIVIADLMTSGHNEPEPQLAAIDVTQEAQAPKPPVLAQGRGDSVKGSSGDEESVAKNDVYYVIGSFRKPAYAERMAVRHVNLKTKVMYGKLGKRKVYRSVIGPFAIGQRKDVQKRIMDAGIEDAWAMRIDQSQWSVYRPAEVAMGDARSPPRVYDLY